VKLKHGKIIRRSDADLKHVDGHSFLAYDARYYQAQYVNGGTDPAATVRSGEGFANWL
jgi:hypothetical protein